MVPLKLTGLRIRPGAPLAERAQAKACRIVSGLNLPPAQALGRFETFHQRGAPPPEAGSRVAIMAGVAFQP